MLVAADEARTLVRIGDGHAVPGIEDVSEGRLIDSRTMLGLTAHTYVSHEAPIYRENRVTFAWPGANGVIEVADALVQSTKITQYSSGKRIYCYRVEGFREDFAFDGGASRLLNIVYCDRDADGKFEEMHFTGKGLRAVPLPDWVQDEVEAGQAGE